MMGLILNEWDPRILYTCQVYVTQKNNLVKLTCLCVSRGNVAIERAQACRTPLFDSPIHVELENPWSLLPQFHFKYIINDGDINDTFLIQELMLFFSAEYVFHMTLELLFKQVCSVNGYGAMNYFPQHQQHVRSPDLIASVFFLQRYLKGKVYIKMHDTLHYLKSGLDVTF